MEAGRGSRRAAQLLGVHGLILALVFKLLGDIGRQGHFSERIQLFIQGLGVVSEFHQLVAVLGCFQNGGGQGTVAKRYPLAGAQALARLCQALPHIALHLAQQQKFTNAAGFGFCADQTGGQNLGIVHNQQITGI